MKPESERGPLKECPVCGEEIELRARSCPHCGADENTGWNDELTRYDGLDLPDASFDSDATSGHPDKPSVHKKLNSASGWWLAALLVTALMIFLLFRGAF